MNEADPRKVDTFRKIVAAVGSKGFGAVFEGLDIEEKRGALIVLRSALWRLEDGYRLDLGNSIVSEGWQNAGFTQDDLYRHPEEVVTQVYRKGKYLDTSDSEYLPSLFPGKAGERLARLFQMYKGHVSQFGQRSIAHLCLEELSFFDLTDGIIIRNTEGSRLVRVNTIDELREFINKLRQTVTRTELERSRDHVARSTLAFPRTTPVGSGIKKNNFIGKIVSKLEQWDAIPEKVSE